MENALSLLLDEQDRYIEEQERYIKFLEDRLTIFELGFTNAKNMLDDMEAQLKGMEQRNNA